MTYSAYKSEEERPGNNIVFCFYFREIIVSDICLSDQPTVFISCCPRPLCKETSHKIIVTDSTPKA